MSKNISDPQIDGYFPEPWEKSKMTNKVWGTPILDEERGTLQQSPNNYIEGLEKRAYGVICTGIFPLTPDEVQIAKEALRKNNGEGASTIRGGRFVINAYADHASDRDPKAHERNAELEKRVDELERKVDRAHIPDHALLHDTAARRAADLEYRVRGLEDTMNNDEEEASVLTRLRAHKDDIDWLKRRLKHLEEQPDILELKSHTHSPKERDEGLRLSDKDQARWDSAMGYVSKTMKAVEEERPSDVAEDLGEAHLAAYGWVRVSRRRDGSLVLWRT